MNKNQSSGASFTGGGGGGLLSIIVRIGLALSLT